MSSFDPDALRAFVRGQTEANRVSRELRAEQGPPPPAESFDRAMRLWELDPDGFRQPRTALEREGIEQVRAAWAKLREARWGL